MSLHIYEQIQKQIEGKKHILICFDKNSKGDAIGSAAAFASFLKQKSQRFDIVSADFALPKEYEFLKETKNIQNALSKARKCILSIDIKNTGLKELSYDLLENKLRIFITPKQGSIHKEQISTAQSEYVYDLIIVLDTPDLLSLGTLYTNNTDLFDRTPIINIDHKQSNEHFGHINLVDITASSTAEIVFALLGRVNGEYINAETATALLTGMIGGTNSFKAENVKTQALSAASELVRLGADRNYIIKNLYRTKSIATFKLWGSVLSHLEYDKNAGLVWSLITREDFARSGAQESDLHAIIKELISNAPEAKVILLLHEHPGSADAGAIHGIVESNGSADALELSKRYKGSGSRQSASFTIEEGKNLKETADEVLDYIRSLLKMR
ncbi:MAG: DHH family phosphoesterase [Candidatus Magasanikbacteria bacterium]|nr:DHH family phosphoesterase [Candidatus Magasanikbacteria bacterium]